LDDVEPRVFKAGKDGFEEIDYDNFKSNVKTNTENIIDDNYIQNENE
jgi:hypothetical protein